MIYSGLKIGRLTVLRRAKSRIEGNYSRVYWMCRCSCGKKKEISYVGLIGGKTTSCGCFRRENPPNVKHRLTGTRTYSAWIEMKRRCFDSKKHNYKDYGGRGITVCKRWMKFESFYKDMGERPEDKTLDRIDVNGNYEPGNCRWATSSEQASNRRTTILVDGGVTLFSFSKKAGIPYSTLYNYLRVKKLPFHRAVQKCNEVAKPKYRKKS